MLLFGITFAAGLVFSIAFDMRSGIDPHRPWLLAFVVVVAGAYFSWCWSKGQTLAMRSWKIRIVDRFGRRVSLLRAAFRYACSWLWLLPPLAVLAPLKLSAGGMAAAVLGWGAAWALASYLHPGRQYPHDLLAGTRLVPSD
jgi:uncharacterized RDD family membrane protein YckC